MTPLVEQTGYRFQQQGSNTLCEHLPLDHSDIQRVEPSCRQHRDRRRRLRWPLHRPGPGLPSAPSADPADRTSGAVSVPPPPLRAALERELRSWEIAPRYDELLAGRGVAWLQDRVERVDASAGRASIPTGEASIPYSRLVMATGSRDQHLRGARSGSALAMGFRSLADVERLAPAGAEICAEGPPPPAAARHCRSRTHGVELACKLADLVGDCAVIELIEQGERTAAPGQGVQPGAGPHRPCSVKDVRLRTQTRVHGGRPGGLLLLSDPPTGPADDEFLPVDGVIWTAGRDGSCPQAIASRPSPARRPPPLPRIPAEGATTSSWRATWVTWLTQLTPIRSRPLAATAQVAFQQAALPGGEPDPIP
jgi:NADH:ubiquinone reductase (non-electrogenic)